MQLQPVSHVNMIEVTMTTMGMDDNNDGNFTRIGLKVHLN
ncbi:hypothetical protein BTN49_1553 [Candidatus Enterovibrio escicola]|uniref:Uncharacterized protein n=1 Tax=Candidatus Enterovibrio escicola TaxID=1927127 RepID=A0A2A5T4B5_9GAMM|nr:hypothetical protein BTN49_1553 [Candidatus Enterovibrio escacola]